jgi:hypothetical protein
MNKGWGTKAAGSYPSVRSFGTTVTRSVIEQYDLDSTWSRWRRGLEYYYQGAYLNFGETKALLYQGTDFEVPVTFTGNRFATKNADSRTHYAIHRSIDENKQLGFVSERYNDQYLYPEYYKNKEIWLKVIVDPESDQLLVRSVGERITDGETAANLSWVLTKEKKPAVYLGKSPPEGISIQMNIPLDEVRDTDFIKNNNDDLQSLLGEAVYMPDFYQNRPISLFDVFTDFDTNFTVELTEFIGGATLQILDTSSGLPPTLGEINEFEQIYSTKKSTGGLNGVFVYEKERYQRFFGKQYLTADVVREQVSSLSYGILPWTIQSIQIDEDNNLLSLTSVPFQMSLQMYTPSAPDRFVIFNDKGFTKQSIDIDANGNYNHAALIPGEKPWQKINLDVDPWIDEIFTLQTALRFADLYTCSCPAYLHAVLRNPETTGDDGNKLNRQQRLPMPTAKSAPSYDTAGILKTAGITQSWATAVYKKSYKLCKHTVASMFIDKIRVMEPNTFPSGETREKFEKKLAEDIAEVSQEFNVQLKRSEVTQIEIIYALAEALNLDDIEIGYVLLTANF